MDGPARRRAALRLHSVEAARKAAAVRKAKARQRLQDALGALPIEEAWSLAYRAGYRAGASAGERRGYAKGFSAAIGEDV